jgi:phospho-N-acetylmuramoyl-pentapeptide-transferase
VASLTVAICTFGCAFIGFLDDWLSIVRKRSLGLHARYKILLQLGLALFVGFVALHFGGVDTSLKLPVPHHNLNVGTFFYYAIVFIVIAGFSNAVNLTDGLDGLATGATEAVSGAYVLIGIWQSNNSCLTKPGPQCYEVRDPRDLAVVAACIMGAAFGFLWWNASPAKIFMGDTGSLALGGALAGLAIVSRTELLLVLLGGLFVLITLSVVIQVGFFKMTRKRVFRMAPLQHHFELVGWGEVTIVIRFWIVAGLFVGLGLGVFYAEWVVGT